MVRGQVGTVKRPCHDDGFPDQGGDHVGRGPVIRILGRSFYPADLRGIIIIILYRGCIRYLGFSNDIVERFAPPEGPALRDPR